MTYTVKRKFVLALMLVLMLLMLVPFKALAQEIVDSDIVDEDAYTEGAFNRHSFYDPVTDRYWVFYRDSTTYVFRSSADEGATWTAPTTISTTSYDKGRGDAVYFDGIYAHTAWDSSAGTYYRACTLNSGGTVNWISSASLVTSHKSLVTLTCDSNGYPWLTVLGIYVYKSSTKNGVWTTEWEYSPYGYFIVKTMVPLTSGKMIAVIGGNDAPGAYHLRAQSWTGSAWGSVVDSTYDIAADSSYSMSYSAVQIGDDVNIVFLQATTNDICYINFSYSTNAFADFTVLYDGSNALSYPCISKDGATDKLWVAWTEAPTANHVYLMTSPDAGASWSTIVDWVTDVDGIPGSKHISGEAISDSMADMHFLYMAGAAMLKFKLVGEVFVVNTLTASPVGLTSATLSGEIVSLGFGSATERGFVLNDSPTLVGASLEGNETGTFNVGVFTHGVTGLDMFSIYWYAAYASNAYGTEYGNWTSFDTVLPIPTPPSGNVTGDTATICSTTAWNFLAMPITNTDIKLTWDWYPTTGNSSVQISIRYDLYHYPGNTTDGTLIYQGTSDVYTHTNLIPGTTYYYRGWLLCGGNYSADYVEDWATTYGSSPVVSPPEQPGGWFQDPSCTAYGKIPLLSDALAAINSGYGFPMTTICVMFTLLWIIILGFVIFLFIHSAMMMVITIAVLIILASIMGLLPLWMIVMTICLGGISIYVSSRT